MNVSTEWMKAWVFFWENFTFFAILFTVPILIIWLTSSIRDHFDFPKSAGSDWIILLVTFDASALLSKSLYQPYLPQFFLKNYNALFVILFLLELILLVVLIFKTEKKLSYSFLCAILNKSQVNIPESIACEQCSAFQLWCMRAGSFVVTYIFFAINIYIFVAK